MRRLFALPALAIPALAAACFGAGQIVQPAPSGSTEDASTLDATQDGPASGSDGSGTGADGSGNEGADGNGSGAPDGGASDVAVDAPAGSVAVVVATPSGPESNVSIVFSNADGSVLATGTTDATGKATQAMSPGGMVTALLGTGTLVTFVEVAPGDVLNVLDTTGVPQPPTDQWLLTGVPTTAAPGGTPNYYVLYGPCSQNNRGVAAPFNPSAFPAISCAYAGPVPTLLTAIDLVNGTALNSLGGFAYSKTSVFPADGGTLDIDLDQTWSPTSTLDVNVTNVPPGVDPSDVEVEHDEYADGYPFAPYPYGPVVTADADAGTESLSYETYPGFADFVQSEARLSAQLFAEDHRVVNGQNIASRSDTIPTTVSFDLSQLLPQILSAGVDNVSAPLRPIVSWTPVGSLASADGTYVVLSDGESYSWTLVVPPSATQVQVPALPASVSSWAPDPTVSFQVLVATVEVDGVSGYAALRTTGTTFVPQAPPAAPPLPKAGVYRSSIYSTE